jgi:hypothetical protein
MKDDERSAARHERDSARTWAQMLMSGLAQTLQRGYFYSGDEDLTLLNEFLHEKLEPAIGRLKRAEKAYEPYLPYHRRRQRLALRRTVKTKKAAA